MMDLQARITGKVTNTFAQIPFVQRVIIKGLFFLAGISIQTTMILFVTATFGDTVSPQNLIILSQIAHQGAVIFFLGAAALFLIAAGPERPENKT